MGKVLFILFLFGGRKLHRRDFRLEVFSFFFYFVIMNLGSEGGGVETSSLMSGSVIYKEVAKKEVVFFASALDFYNVVNKVGSNVIEMVQCLFLPLPKVYRMK